MLVCRVVVSCILCIGYGTHCVRTIIVLLYSIVVYNSNVRGWWGYNIIRGFCTGFVRGNDER
jgi:hypothetical protein